MVSIYGGTGFIGSKYHQMFGGTIVNRESVVSPSNDLLYFISTTNNYNVFEQPLIDIETNLIHLIKFLDTNKDRPITINFISSWFVYGDALLPAYEDAKCNPKGFYSITKKCAEDLLVSYCKTFGLSYRILRLSNVYGIGDNYSKKKNALQFLIDQVKQGNDVSLYHNGEFIRDYLYVDDICRAIECIINKGELNTIYNIGSGIPYNFKDLIDIAIVRSKSKSQVKAIEPPKFHQLVQVKDMYLNTTKLQSLGFTPLISIDEGVEKLLNHSSQ